MAERFVTGGNTGLIGRRRRGSSRPWARWLQAQAKCSKSAGGIGGPLAASSFARSANAVPCLHLHTVHRQTLPAIDLNRAKPGRLHSSRKDSTSETLDFTVELRKPHKLPVIGLSSSCATTYIILLWKRYRTACYGADQQQFDVKPTIAENMATPSLLCANRSQRQTPPSASYDHGRSHGL